MRYKGR